MIIGAGFRPVVELGFLPRALVPVPTWRGLVQGRRGRDLRDRRALEAPPEGLRALGGARSRLVPHCVERYGRAAVEQWAFEVWNEPTSRTTGREPSRTTAGSTTTAWRATCRPAVRPNRRARHHRAGRPGGRAYLRRFLRTAWRAGTRRRARPAPGSISCRSTRRAPTTRPAASTTGSARRAGAPVEREDAGDIRAGLDGRGRPGLPALPVLVDECDPAVGTIYGVHDNPNFVVTNSEHYPTFLCALVRRSRSRPRLRRSDRLRHHVGLLHGGQALFEGNRTLVTNENVDKPILNGLRMLGRPATRGWPRGPPRRDVLSGGRPDTRSTCWPPAGERLTVLVCTRPMPGGTRGRPTVSPSTNAVRGPGRRSPLAHRRPALERVRGGAVWVAPRTPRRRRWPGSRAARARAPRTPRPPRGRRGWDPDAAGSRFPSTGCRSSR